MSNQAYLGEIFSSIQGEGYLAGRRQIFIRMTDCNLECRYCDTDYQKSDHCRVETRPGSGVFSSLPQPISLDTISTIVSEWNSLLPGAHHSISFTGGEPLLSSDVLMSWLPALRRMLPIHLETNGTMHLALETLLPHLDYISMDIKLPSTSGCTEHLWDLHKSFLAAARGKNISVKIVVGEDTPQEEIRGVCDIITDVDRATPLFLQPVTQPSGEVHISAACLFRLQETASSLLPDVRVIPQMHRMLGAL